MLRVGHRGGAGCVRLPMSDLVAEAPQRSAGPGSPVVARLSVLDRLLPVWIVDASVEFTHEVAPGMHGAIVRAGKPAAPVAAACCAPSELATCCEPDAKASCCGSATAAAPAACACR